MKTKTLFLCLLFLQLVSVTQAQDLKVVVNKKGKIGFVDSMGNEVVKCTFDNVLPFNNGVAIVSKSEKFGMLDANGTLILPVKYSQISLWSEGIYLIKSGKKMGLCDLKGNILLPVKYSHISKLNCYGKAWVSLGGKATNSEHGTYISGAKYGVVDAEGNMLIVPTYKGLYEFSFNAKGVFPLCEGMRLEYTYHYIKDTLVTDCSYMGFSKNALSIYKSGLLDANGNVLLEAKEYDVIMKPSGGMLRYYITKKKNTICGYYNIDTKEDIVVADFKTAYEDMNYWSHGDFNGDIAPVNGTTFSFVDKKGKVLRTGYLEVEHSQNTSLWAAKTSAGTWDVFDEMNNNLVNLSKYTSIGFPTNKTDKELYNVIKNGMHGCVNRNGDVVIPFEYEMIHVNIYNFVLAKRNGKWGVLSVDNKVIIPFEYQDVILPTEYNQRNFWVVKSDKLYYHLNLSTNKLSQKGYGYVQNFKDGIAFVSPSKIHVPNNQINVAQCFAPGTPTATIKDSTGNTELKFGHLINEADETVFDLPLSELYVEAAKNEILKLDGRMPTENDKRKILLEVTKTNRSYDLNSVLEDDAWDY